jgi:uncharacterized C2H2 Zn-finger protein
MGIGGTHMTKWLLVCPRCDHKFAHVKINDAAVTKAYLESFGVDSKPDLGERMLACPYCEMESLYRRFHLICEDDSDKDAKGKGA